MKPTSNKSGKAASQGATLWTLNIKLVFGIYAKGPWAATIEIDSSATLEELHLAIQSAVGSPTIICTCSMWRERTEAAIDRLRGRRTGHCTKQAGRAVSAAGRPKAVLLVRLRGRLDIQHRPKPGPRRRSRQGEEVSTTGRYARRYSGTVSAVRLIEQ